MNRSLLQLLAFNSSSTGHLLRNSLCLIILALLILIAPLTAHALLPPPPPDGGYPNENTAEGDGALFDLTTGGANTAVGSNALTNNTSGYDNTATGAGALFNNTTGVRNTAAGVNALAKNTNGGDNTANGNFALFNNTTGDNNTASGRSALYINTSGGSNTATGASALFRNSGGSLNTANGVDALHNNTTAWFNTAMGSQALYTNTTGLSNTATGYQALYRATGGGNIALGFQAGVNLTTGGNNIDIGNVGVAGEAGKIRIGTKGTHNGTFIAGISGVAVTGAQVVVNTNGKLGVAASSARFKKAIKRMDHVSQAIHQLEPVTFRYDEELDPNGLPQFGLIAEEVEKVSPDLVVRDEEEKLITVRYEAVNAMLLNEFLKEHRKVEKHQATIAELKSSSAKQAATVAQQQKQIEALTAGLQNVSEKIELTEAKR